jgi:hypothetical protein
MSAWWWLLLPLAGAYALGKTMAQQEAETRLSQLPSALIRLAVRRLPPDLRDDMAAEWKAELEFILTGTDGLPLTRLWRGTRYAGSLLASARRTFQHEPAGRTLAHRAVGATALLAAPTACLAAAVVAFLICAGETGAGYGLVLASPDPGLPHAMAILVTTESLIGTATAAVLVYLRLHVIRGNGRKRTPS